MFHIPVKFNFWVLIVFVLGFSYKIQAQNPKQSSTTNSEKIEEEIFIIVDQIPEPEEGFEHFFKYIGKNISFPKSYRSRCFMNDVRIFIRFVVRKNAVIDNFEILKGMGEEFEEFDKEAIRVIKSYPHKWHPGTHQGENVDVKMTIPVIFHIN